MRMRRKSTIAYLVIFALGLIASLVGCDPVARHKTLTFFFDGVPLLGSEQDQNEQGDTRSTQQRDRTGTSEAEENVLFVHEPRKTCTNCHEKRDTRQGSLSLARLVTPAPELCFRCHTDFYTLRLFVHGPVVTGDCLFCHEAHKSKIAGLLKKAEPELCYQCHEILESTPIPGHPSDPKQQCTKCHDPHAGSDRKLLKN